MLTKTFRAPLAVKAGETGEVEAVFATLNVIDWDGDVTLPGAFGEQRVLIEQWNHNMSEPPVGRGMIGERGDEAVLTGQFFLETQAGREHHAVIKNLADMQEWSYTFRVLEAEPGTFNAEPVRFLKKLEVAGVGPVTRGAGVGTRTTAIKGQSEALPASNGSDESKESDEGEAGNGKPSGVSPSVVLVQIEILALED